MYRARDLRLGREVALKVLPAEVAASPERLARFEPEARTVAALNLPTIFPDDLGIWDMSRDRRRILRLVPTERPMPQAATILQHWESALRRP